MLLYKYLNSERLDVLSNGTIRYTQPMYLNDPHELKPNIDGLVAEDFAKKVSEQVIIENVTKFTHEFVTEKLLPLDWRARTDIAKNIILLCGGNNKASTFSSIYKKEEKKLSNDEISLMYTELLLETFKQRPEILEHACINSQKALTNLGNAAIPQVLEGIVKSANELIGILCLSETPLNLQMWAHYADEGKGYVIGFDSTNQYFGMNNVNDTILNKVMKVRYSKDKPKVIISDYADDRVPSEDRLLQFAYDFIFTKAMNWSYEEEWRMLKNLKEAEITLDSGKVFLMKYPKTSVSSIIVGYKTPEERINEIVRIANEHYPHAQCFKAELNTINYGVSLKKLLNY